MQVQTSEQTFFHLLILGKSRFPPKKSFITSTTGSKKAKLANIKNNLHIILTKNPSSPKFSVGRIHHQSRLTKCVLALCYVTSIGACAVGLYRWTILSQHSSWSIGLGDLQFGQQKFQWNLDSLLNTRQIIFNLCQSRPLFWLLWVQCFVKLTNLCVIF